MSSPLAIAAVTAGLKDLLNDGLLDNDLSSIGSFTVTALPPDRVTDRRHGAEPAQSLPVSGHSESRAGGTSTCRRETGPAAA